MPRVKRANVRDILRKRLEKPETAEDVVDALLSFLNAPDKAKAADVLKLLDFAADGQSEGKPKVPGNDEDLSRYSDADLRQMLRKLEGGKARGPQGSERRPAQKGGGA